MEIDSSLIVKQKLRGQYVFSKYKNGRFVLKNKHIILPVAYSANGKLSDTAFADDFIYYVSNDASAFTTDLTPKMAKNVPCNYLNPNSEDGCDIDLTEVSVNVATIPQTSKSYMFSRRSRELALRIFLPLLMLFALPMMNSCKERDDPMPQPTPEPEPTPVIPTKEITIDWTWNDFDNYNIVSVDSVKKYTDMEDVKFVFLNLVDEDNGRNSSRFSARTFHMVYEDLQPRFDISNKVRGSGTIFVSMNGGAQAPDSAGGTYVGMYASDSTKFANWGYVIKRYSAQQNSK